MKELPPPGGLICYWSNLKEHPKCPHGPALLFGREINGLANKFYACAACRDRKLCPFYIEHGTESKQQKHTLDRGKAKILPSYPHQKLFILYNQLMTEHPSNRAYCHTCEKFLHAENKPKHTGHEIQQNLSDYEMLHPTELLKPLTDAKREAQFLFSNKAVTDITSIMTDLHAESVICIGAPRIHEYITQNMQGKVSSLLMDFDGRFHNFYGPLSYCWYNLFNHHFFQEYSESVFKDFLQQNKGKNMFLVCDPPFGGRVEPISQTLKIISDLHKKLNKIDDDREQIRIFFIFPYFMESVMREKSNPPNISGGLKDLKMSDYKVEYDNHPLFVLRPDGKKQGSQIRLFTNVPLGSFKLPESDGYKFCKRCDKWVASENKHCKICRDCTSKDGRRYKHCKLCQRCVKPTWQHCGTCGRCLLQNHKCGRKPKIGSCFKCNQIGHTEKECNTTVSENIKYPLKKQERKIKDNSLPKKRKIVSLMSGPKREAKKLRKALEASNEESIAYKADNSVLRNEESSTKKRKKKNKISPKAT